MRIIDIAVEIENKYKLARYVSNIKCNKCWQFADKNFGIKDLYLIRMQK